MMPDLLARAAIGDPLNENALMVLVASAAAGAAAVLATLPVVTARRRGHRSPEGVLAAAVVWALVAAAAVVWAVDQHRAAAADRERRIESGDLDPRSPDAASPTMPYAAGFGLLAAAYAGIGVWAARGLRPAARLPDPGPPD